MTQPPFEVPGAAADLDGIPEDVDSAAPAGYGIPDTVRRRVPGIVYLIAAAATGGAVVAGLPDGMWVVAGAIALLGVYHLVAAPRLHIREAAALATACRAAGFPAGHASARVGFVGWRARPVWNVLVVSAEDPPGRQALVRVDGRDGRVLESFAEAIASGS